MVEQGGENTSNNVPSDGVAGRDGNGVVNGKVPAYMNTKVNPPLKDESQDGQY